MKIRQFSKNFDTVLGLRSDLWKLQCILRGKFSTAALRRYVESHRVRKLQIGAGPIVLPGWLGTDLRPTDTVAFLDATKPFPIQENLFDYIHSEHMIEHVTWFEGLAMLRECRRILKPGGKIRIATPDLQVHADLYQQRDNYVADKFIKFNTDYYLRGTPAYKLGFVINSAFYRWGHKYLYDGEVLEMTMQQAGFVEIKRFAAGESDDENLRGVEMHGRIGNNQEDMNAFETMVFEGICPTN